MKATKHAFLYKTSTLSIKSPNNSFPSSNVKKQNYLKNIYITPSKISLTNINTVQMYLDSPIPLSLPIKHFTSNDVKFTIQKYSLGKSLGFNLITAVVVICLSKRVSTFLTHNLNTTP